ncbi:MAG: DUF4440 domain-containing protein [Gemmatimonadetes bacterium]|nr:DUF4440 domain-containing protein [Gemmatimonadota bacterium]
MRVRSAVSHIPLLVLIAACGPTDRPPASPETFDAESHVAAWVDLWNTGDLARVDELFLTDSSVTYFSSEREGLIEGFAAVRAHHEGFGFVDGGTQPEQELWVADVRSSMYGDVAVVGAIWQFGDRSAPVDSIQRGPMTAVYVRAGDRYRIAHMHFAEYLPD